MPSRNQLEIISPTGEIEFYDLDLIKGVSNIGRHLENDIVLDSPGVASFHAVLDHRQEPYQIVVLSEEGETTLGGQPLSPNVSTALHVWDTVEVGGYALVLLEGAGVAARPAPPVPAPVPPEPLPAAPVVHDRVVPAPMPEVGAPLPAPAVTVPGLPVRPSDRDDEVILTELSEREWTIDVNQTATCDVTITNGGAIVATFGVRVEGVDASWVVISPPQVNLYEGQGATVAITITPPRHPSSRAGAHHLAVVVTSPNHPGRSSQKGATLTINPYYEFAVGELAPKRQTISWRQRSGEAVLPIANKGNSEAPFRIEAEDDERACTFEFQVPGEAATLARQAEMRLPPEETFAIPMQITPHSRSLVALRKRSYSYNVTTSMPEAGQMPRSVMGQLRSKPLIGPWLLALMLLSLAILVAFLFRPTISTFYAEPPVVMAGTPVALYWEASTFANLNIEGIGKVDRRSGRITVVPAEATTYRLEAHNWLSQISASWFGDTKEAPVAVTPVLPDIRIFEVSKSAIIRGESIVLRWEVVNADRLVLKINGAPQELLSTEHAAQRQLTPDGNTTYVLEAYNRYTGDASPVTASQDVQVADPTLTPTLTPTPVPTPDIEFFQVEPNEITLGEKVVFNWAVAGIFTQVQLEPIGPVDQVGPAIYEPEREGTLSFWLRAFNGQVEARRLQNVLVLPAPTGTPEPQTPQIEYFRITPKEVVKGDAQPIQLSWLVTGDTTNIEVSGPTFGKTSNLQAEGSLPATADKTTFFVLTAFNDDLSASETVELTVQEPTPLPTPTDTPTPTPTPIPPPIIVFFNAEESAQVVFVGGDPPTYQVEVGSNVNLRWSVQNADTLTLISLLVGSQDQDPTSTGKTVLSVMAEDTYQLTAQNAGGTTQASLRIQLKLPGPPPSPSSVNGEPLTNTVKITWNYGTQDESKIQGFRVYRADMPPGSNFSRVADEDDLGPSSGQWVDQISPTCGKVYYIVAVYLDVISGEKKETDASSTSWSSPPCP